jgi:hypothetical protein
MWAFLVEDYRDRGSFIWTLGRLGDWKYGRLVEYKYIPAIWGTTRICGLTRSGRWRFCRSENGDADSRFLPQRATGFSQEILDGRVAHWGGGGAFHRSPSEQPSCGILQEAGFAADGVVP